MRRWMRKEVGAVREGRPGEIVAADCGYSPPRLPRVSHASQLCAMAVRLVVSPPE